jgi:serine phosphatase RsbU (regulator of sigma subunit)
VAVARSREPSFFVDGEAIQVTHPTVGPAALGGALAVLPMATRSASLGVLVLRWPRPRTIEGDLRDLLAALSGYAGLALERARLLEHRRDVAHVLQEAMLTHLPAPDGIALDGAYSPASMGEQVGGDWYDALVLPGRGTAVMIGDVTGHDIDAAALMGQLRSLLRGYTWADEDQPSVVLRRLDAANIGTGLGATASVVLGHVEPPAPDGSRVLRWSSAGHLPPFVKRADGSVERLDAHPDLILGVVPEAERHDHDVVLHPGDVLVLYTDGLVERRGEPLHVGLERLASALRESPAPEPRRLVETLVPDEFHQDDTAVLTVRVGEPEGE